MVTFRVLLASFFFEIELMVETAYAGILLVYLVYRLATRALAGNLRFNSFEIYMGLLFLLPIIAAIGAQRVFGQPLFYGMGASRDFYLLYGGLVVYDLLRRNAVSIELVERMFVFTAWATLIFYYAVSLLIDPGQYKETGLAGSNPEKGGEVYYRFNMAFMFFGSIYYIVKGFYQKRYHFFGYAALFLFYIFFMRLDRTSMAVVIAAITMFFLTGLHPKRLVLWLGFVVLVLAAGGLAAIIFFPTEVQQYQAMFREAMELAGFAQPIAGDETIRVYEMNVALEQIARSPIIGNGRLSNHWVEGGYNRFFGFFYPSDIGVPGQIFIYGFPGAMILYAQFFFALWYASRIKTIKRNVFLVTIKFFMLTLGLDALTNGYVTMYAAQSITALAIIYFFFQKDKIARLSSRA